MEELLQKRRATAKEHSVQALRVAGNICLFEQASLDGHLVLGGHFLRTGHGPYCSRPVNDG